MLVDKLESKGRISEDCFGLFVKNLRTLLSDNTDEWSITREIEKFIGAKIDKIVCESFSFEGHEPVNAYYALDKYLRINKKHIVKILNHETYSETKLSPVLKEKFKIDYDQEKTFMVRGVVFLNCVDYQKRFVIHCKRPDFVDYTEIVFYFRAEDDSIQKEITSLFKSILNSYELYKGKKIYIDERKKKFLPPQNTEWEDLVFPDEIISEIKRNTFDFFSNLDALKRHNIPLRRAVLLSGKPGTGKTLIGKLLATKLNTAFLWITPQSMGSISDISAFFRFARAISPVLIFMEDVDFSLGNRILNADRGSLGEALSQMDGMLYNDCIVIIATTNDPESLDEAMIERPGRFDKHIKILPPDDSGREKMLTNFLNTTELIDRDYIIEQLVSMTDDFTGAHLKELVISTKMNVILNNGKTENMKLSLSDFEVALDNLKKTKQRVGFGLSK